MCLIDELTGWVCPLYIYTCYHVNINSPTGSYVERLVSCQGASRMLWKLQKWRKLVTGRWVFVGLEDLLITSCLLLCFLSAPLSRVSAATVSAKHARTDDYGLNPLG